MCEFREKFNQQYGQGLLMEDLLSIVLTYVVLHESCKTEKRFITFNSRLKRKELLASAIDEIFFGLERLF